jgi:hypothetical protein
LTHHGVILFFIKWDVKRDILRILSFKVNKKQIPMHAKLCLLGAPGVFTL